MAALLGKIDDVILNPLITLLFGIALLYLFIGIFQFINSASADTKREEGKKKILYGIIGMFIMFSAYGIIRILLGTFKLQGQVPAFFQGKL